VPGERRIIMKGLPAYLKKAYELGFTRVKIIDTKTVVTAGWVRAKCQFGCSGFGKYLTCPPFSPGPVQMRNILAEYRRGLLLQVENIPPAKEDRIWRKMKRAVVKLERDFFLDGFYKA
jgi:predicted metal-binding protein